MPSGSKKMPRCSGCEIFLYFTRANFAWQFDNLTASDACLWLHQIILTQVPPEPLEDRPAKRARPEEAEVEEARSPGTDAEHALQVEAE